MPVKEFESLAQRYERFEKVNFPLQANVITCATNSANALKVYFASNRSPEAEASVIECLNKWRSALDEYERNKGN